MAATIPADIAQYYGYMLRVTQKLMYLYGFPEIDVTEKGKKKALTKGTIYPSNPDHVATDEENEIIIDVEDAEMTESVEKIEK